MPPTAWWMSPHKRGTWSLLDQEISGHTEGAVFPKAFSRPGSEAPVWKQQGEAQLQAGRMPLFSQDRPPGGLDRPEVKVSWLDRANGHDVVASPPPPGHETP